MLLFIDIVKCLWTIVVIALGTLLVLHIIDIEHHIPVRLLLSGLVAETKGITSDKLVVAMIGVV